MGRPEKELDWDRLDKLSQLPLRAEDIAWVLGVSTDTISRRLKEQEGITFAEYLDQKRATLRMNLLAKQFEVAMKGNVALLIWLGKQHLDQKDKVENTNKNEHRFSDSSDADIDAKIAAMLAKQQPPKEGA